MHTADSPQRPARTRAVKTLKALTVIALVTSVLGLVYIRAQHAAAGEWQQYLQGLSEADQFRLPPPVADADNFAESPLWIEHGYYRTGVPASQPLSAGLGDSFPLHSIGNFRAGTWTRVDHLESSQTPPDPAAASRTARALLDQFPLEHHRLSELRIAAKRPSARFEMHISYDAPAVNFFVLRLTVRMMSYHALCELLAGNPSDALQDALVLHQIDSGLRGHPSLVIALIRTAATHYYIQPFYEGWARKQWSPQQYAAQQKHFERVDLLENLDLSLLGERDSMRHLVETKSDRELIDHFGIAGVDESKEPLRGMIVKSYLRAMPRGWWQRNLLRHHKLIDSMRTNFYDLRAGRVYPQQVDSMETWLGEQIQTARPYHHLASVAVPRISRAIRNVAQAQISCDQAAIVCALERFKYHHGEYPKNLTLLTPHYIREIPRDMITGDMPIYRKLKDGTFHLYSVGWDGIDHGGTLQGNNDFVTPGSDFIWLSTLEY